MKVDLKGNTSQDTTTGKNKCPNELVNGSSNSVSYTRNSDGTITLTGTATARVEPVLINRNYTLASGTYKNTSDYLIIGHTTNSQYILFSTSSNTTLNADTTFDSIYFRIDSGTATNKIYYPQIILSSVADTSFEKFTGGQPSPSPDYPQDIQVVSGDNTIKVEGKNLFDYSTNVINSANLFYNNSSDTYIKSDDTCKLSYIQCKPNTTYTISRRTPMTQRFAVATTETTPTIGTDLLSYDSAFDNTTQSITITTPANAHYIVVRFIQNEVNNYETYAKTIQIEYGNQPSTYTPYVSQTYPISLGNIELCKIGDYQDSIVKDNGKWYLNKQIGKVVLSGSREWNYISVSQGSLFRNLNDITTNSIVDSDYAPYCNYYLGIPLSQTRANNNIMLNNGSGGSNYHYLDIIDNRFTNATDFKNWLNETTPVLYYALATPTYEEITGELLSQLEALAYSYDGTTNISQVNDDMPFVLDITALKEVS